MDGASFEVSMTNYSQDITEKSFQRQLVVLTHKQISLCNMKMEKKTFHILFKENHVIMLLTNVLLVDNFIKRYQIDFMMNFYCF